MSKSHDIIEEPNYIKLRELMAKHGLTAKAVAELTGYAETTIYGFTMPDRMSERAGNVTDRFMELFTLKLQAQGLETN